MFRTTQKFKIGEVVYYYDSDRADNAPGNNAYYTMYSFLSEIGEFFPECMIIQALEAPREKLYILDAEVLCKLTKKEQKLAIIFFEEN